MNEHTPDSEARYGPVQFPSTRTTLVFDVSNNPERAEQAMRELCERYHIAIEGWFRVHQPEIAGDLAHEFIGRWLSRNRLLQFEKKAGIRFRFFLATCLGNFLKDYFDREHAGKRGQGNRGESIEALREGGHEVPSGTDTAPPLLDCQLACAVHERVMQALRVDAEKKKDHHLKLFECLCRFVPFDQSDESYAQVAAQFNLRVGTVRAKVCRLRDDYFVAFRSEVNDMTENARTDADEETHYLLELLPQAFERLHPAG
jgi:hypothetical protein